MLKNVPVNKVDKASNRPKGNYIETLASAYLSREGYQILARNYAYMGGELDIVARDRETLVFVEVKSVWNNQQGNPAARVNTLKQKKIWKTACHFIATQKEHAPLGFDTPCRFDVLTARAYQKPLQFAHYKNAFEGTQVIPQL
jgi:putative endonuclease